MGWRSRVVVVTCLAAFAAARASAVDVSAPPILQWFDSTYKTQERRVADFFVAGYGSTWIPPTGRADSGNMSVGYDVFDRFDLGSPSNPTLYGTERGLKQFASTMHRAGGSVVADLIWNHNGFSDLGRSGFAAQGGYPGFVLTASAAVDGDFHGVFESGDLNGRLAGLVDIKHETNLQYIRTPVAANDPRNIPAGTIWNKPDAANARFYPDRNLGGTAVYNPLTGQSVTLYDFNTASPSAGDAVPENALGLLMRNARWMINDIGVDGFRLDAARHFEPWVMGYFDQAVYRANRRTLLNGAPMEVFSFSESASTDRSNLMSQFVRKDVGTLPAGQIAGNRDALDFAQFWPIKNNLTADGAVNDFRNMVNAGLDAYDDGRVNGSAGVVFVQSHDDFGPDMLNVAYAFSLMRPGNAIVYYNANEHYDPSRGFPKQGRGDALGNFGDRITTLVDLRGRYGRGDYRERWLEKENYAFERSNSALVLLSNRNDSGYDSRSMAVDFTLGSRLVELTGNAARANAAAGSSQIPEVLPVVGTTGSRYVNARFLRNNAQDQGYLVYGLPTPKSAAGIEFLGPGVGPVIAGETPAGFQGGETTAQATAIHKANATSRLADMQVITGDTFTVRLATQAVTLADGYRDRHADGDQAMLRINGGLDLNGNGFVDVVAPGDVSYGFENFNSTRITGYSQASGNGLFEQVIDTTRLPEGMNFLTVRSFRHRDLATGGDGGPAVFSEFKEVLYVDRLPPEAAFNRYVPFAGTGNNDVWLESADGTADSMYVFQNVPAATSNATILAWANAGQGITDKIDQGIFKKGFFSVPNGNNVYTVVTKEITGTYNIQRLTGQTPASGRGAGFGDLNFDGIRAAADISGQSYSFETILASKNASFNAAADVSGDGLVDTRDLLLLEGLLSGSANSAAASALAGVKFRRVNFVNDAAINEADLGLLRAVAAAPAGADLWTFDLDVSGTIDDGDVQLAQQRFGVAPGVGVPASLTWTASGTAPGGAGTWTTGATGWRGAITDAALPMPLVPGSKARFSGAGIDVTVSGTVLAAGGLEFSPQGSAMLSGTGTILLAGTGASAREITVTAGEAVIAARLASSSGLLKTGSGTLVLSAMNALSGSATLHEGTLRLGHPSALAASSVVVTGGTFSLGGELEASVGGLGMTPGAGLVDLEGGRLSIAAGGIDPTTLVGLLVAGRGDGTWNGESGITSSSVSALITAGQPRSVGWLQADDGSFVVAGAAPGDMDLDGAIDILDISGFLSAASFNGDPGATWQRGDFNYDTVVDALDIADLLATDLFDQGSYLASASLPRGAVATVPEPSGAAGGVAMAVILAAAAVGRGWRPGHPLGRRP